MVETTDDTKTGTIALITPITCSGSTPHYPTGCALLKHYDLNNDGMTSTDGSIRATEDHYAGLLTQAEVFFVIEAKDAGSINALCPGCYTPPDPCAGVTCPNKCTGYDLFSQKCVEGVCINDALIEANSPTCGYTPPAPAQGLIVEMDVPASVNAGASYDIQAKTKNTGGSAGLFKMQLLINGMVQSVRPPFTLAAGATSTDRIPAATAPTSGTSMSYAIKCIQIHTDYVISA